MRLGDATIGTRRIARKTYPACGGYCRPINPGDVYLEVVEFPGEFNGGTAPVRMRVCAECTLRRGHGHIIDPIPDRQYGSDPARYDRAYMAQYADTRTAVR